MKKSFLLLCIAALVGLTVQLKANDALDCIWKTRPDGTKYYVCCYGGTVGGWCYEAPAPKPPPANP